MRSANDVEKWLFERCKKLQSLAKSETDIGINLVDTSMLFDELAKAAAASEEAASSNLPTFHEGQANFYKSLNIVQPTKPDPASTPAEAAERTRVKMIFQKCLKNYRGRVISIGPLRKLVRTSASPFLESWSVRQAAPFKYEAIVYFTSFVV